MLDSAATPSLVDFFQTATEFRALSRYTALRSAAPNTAGSPWDPDGAAIYHPSVSGDILDPSRVPPIGNSSAILSPVLWP